MTEELGRQDFSRVLQYVRMHTGMKLPETNYMHTQNFIVERVGKLHCSIDEYLLRLDVDPEEKAAFIDTATINETYFFREEHHFSVLGTHILPELYNRRQTPLRMWSAACATGEEPLSLYFIGKQALGSDDLFVVYGSDVSENTLSTFQKGRYSPNSFRSDGQRYHELIRAVSAEANGIAIIPEQIISRIRRSAVNLDTIQGNPFDTLFDVILLRNVLIYFHPEDRDRIIENVVRLLDTEGVLMVSATEIPVVNNRRLQLVEYDGVFCFRKRSIEDLRAGVLIDPCLITNVKREERNSTVSIPSFATGDLDQAIHFVNTKLNNRRFVADNDPSYHQALSIIEILYLINAQQFETAEESLAELERTAGPHEVIFYLNGYIRMARSDAKGGIQRFGKSLACNPHFWPARYWRAILYAKIGELLRAHKDFAMCANHIDDYIEKNSYRYEFLLEGFNGRYFRRSCENWIEKTSVARKMR